MVAIAPIRRRPAVAAALAVLLIAGGFLSATRHSAPLPLPPPVAIHDALRNAGVHQALAGTHWTHASESPIAGGLARITFLRGTTTVAEVAVHADGSTDQVQVFGARIPFGNWIGYEPAVLIGLSIVFLLMVTVVPLRRRRNLDALASLSLVASVPLFQHGQLSLSVLVVVPGLVYLLARSVWAGLGDDAGAQPSVPLFSWVTSRWPEDQRVRVLRMLAATLALVLVLIGVGTPNALDIPYAVMEGATVMAHGLLPYGHMPGDVIHGDTYPILSYALYVPVAVISPVHSIFDSIVGALVVAAGAALCTAAAILRGVAGRRIPGEGRAAADEARGLRAAIAWLAFPPLMIIASSGTTDLVLVAVLIFAILLWRRPAASTGLLALAGWFKLAPFALLPLWLAPRRGAELRRALAVVAGVTAAALALVVGLGGTHGVSAMAHALSYQFDRQSLQSPWVALDAQWAQPLGQAAVLALITGVTIAVFRRPVLMSEPRRVAALAGAILIGLELTANYWSFLYLAWFVPLLGLSLFADRPSRPAGLDAVAVSVHPSSVAIPA